MVLMECRSDMSAAVVEPVGLKANWSEMTSLECYTTRPSILSVRALVRVCDDNQSTRYIAVVLSELCYNYYTRAHRRWWRVSTVTQLFRLDAKTITVEITLALTSQEPRTLITLP